MFAVSLAGCEKESTLNDQNDSKAQIRLQDLTRGDKLRYNYKQKMLIAESYSFSGIRKCVI
ncbi:MAG: hypothetical protein ACQPRJ_00625 [Solitalea-like symbiont of Acarus siro]